MSQAIQADEKLKTGTHEDDVPPDLAVKSCSNCGEALTGTYCLSCGQKDFNMLRPFWSLMEDMLDDLFSFDKRFFGTLVPLMFRPGYVTREFNRGRRASFVPPFRQYLVISVVFFLLLVSIDIKLFSAGDITIDSDALVSETSQPVPADQTDATSPAPGEQISKEKITIAGSQALRNLAARAAEKLKAGSELKQESDTDKRIFETVQSGLLGAAKVWDDPGLLNEIISDWLPKLMFLMLPFFALILKLVYIRRKRYYIEHLIFSLHYHAFLFLLFTVMLLLYHYLPASHGYLSYFLWYIPIYLLVAIWIVYRQGPVRTFFKAIFVSFTYATFMSISLFSVLVYGLTKV